MVRELRYSLRSLWRTPIFAIAATAILALAVGANTAVFSMLYALVLRPLPVPAPHELVQLSTRDRFDRLGDLTLRQFRELLDNQRAFSAVLGSFSQTVLTVEAEGTVLRVSVGAVTGNYFRELGAIPTIGRLLTEADEDLHNVTAEPVAVLSWSFWQRQYGGNSAVLGRTLRVEGRPLTIVGVAPKGFLGLGITIEDDVTFPLTLAPSLLDNEMAMARGTQRWIATTGRLAPSISLAQARAHIEALWPSVLEAAVPVGLPADYMTPDRRERYFDAAIQVESGATGIERGLRGRYSKPLWTLLAIAALVLAIAAVNLCALIFARLDSRRREFGVRLALGAGRWPVVREAMFEGVIIGVGGAVGGVLFASYTSTALAAFLLRDYAVPTALNVAPDTLVIIVGAVASIAVGAGITLIAACIVTRSARTAVSSRATRAVTGSSRIGRMLISAQAALSIVLLIHAALLARNVYNITSADSGLTTDSVLTGYPIARPEGYRNLNPHAYYRQAFERLLAIPGVQSVAFSEYRPEYGALPVREAVSDLWSTERASVAAETTHVSPGFFKTMGISIVQGRDFSFADTNDTPRVAVISRQLARHMFGENRGLGERIRIGSRPQWQNLEIIGIASDARVFDLRGGNAAVAYVPFLQSGDLAHYKFLIARAPASAAPAVRQAIESLGIETMPRIQTLEYARGRALLQERVMASVGAYFSVLTLALVSAGLYGLLTFVLSLRRKEFAIRLALGAEAGSIGRSIAADGLRIVGIGVALGLVAALASVRALQSVLAATSPYDSTAILAACATLFCITAIASTIPALRASRVQPVEELRRE